MAGPVIRRIRKRVFAGCEGRGECALLVAIQHLCDECGLPVHLIRKDCDGGSPLHIMETAKRHRVQEAKREKIDGGSFVFLDDDRLKRDRNEPEVRRAAIAAKFQLVVQVPKLECLLGRLIARDMSLGDIRAEKALMEAWPGFTKSFAAMDIFQHGIDLDAIRLLAVRSDWKVFLRVCGIIPPPMP